MRNYNNMASTISAVQSFEKVSEVMLKLMESMNYGPVEK